MNDELDRALARVVSGEPGSYADLAARDPDVLLRRAEAHGVLPLLAHRVSTADGVDPDLRERLRSAARHAVAADLLRSTCVVEALTALAAAGVSPLLMKGEQVAHRWYPRPDLRPRLDTDLLIPLSARPRAVQVLEGLGYRRARHVTGDLLSYQATYVRWHEGYKLHVFDLHWRIANPQIFSGLLIYDDMSRDAMPLRALGAFARGLPAPAALLLACVHRVAHHYDSSRLIWLYDVHVIAASLSESEWSAFAELAESRNVRAVCTRGLSAAADCFRTPVPALVTARLGAGAGSEPSAGYLNPRRRALQDVADDLLALPRWRDRVKLLREHLFPSPQYMREVYALSSRAPLPVLYATRALRGAWRRLGRVPLDDASRIR